MIRKKAGVSGAVLNSTEGATLRIGCDMTDSWILKGRILSGAGRGTFFTQLDWVQDQCLTKLGFGPFPGTLNIEVEEEYVPFIEQMQKEEGVVLVPPDLEFCCGRALPANVEGVSAAVILPEEEVRIHGKRIIEIIADKRLKDLLSLKDGDQVTVAVRRPVSNGAPEDS